MLFSIILFLSFLQNALDVLVKLVILLIKQFLATTPSFKNFKALQAELHDLVETQKKISMMDEFAKHARLQRKIDELKDKINTMSSSMSTKVAYFRTVLYWTLRISIALCFVYIAFVYRYQSVSQVEESIFPFRLLALTVAFPTGKPGNVGCLFWIFFCQVSIRTFVKHVKSHL